MGYQLDKMTNRGGRVMVGAEQLRERIERLARVEGPRFRRLWAYYRNPMRNVGVMVGESGSERPYRQAQEWGMPSRITGVRSGREVLEGQEIDGVARKEVVIENDIGWRIDTMVDYLFGKPVAVRSAAPDPQRREVIDGLVRAILTHNGGLLFLQQLALLGAVYGFVDVLVKVDVGCLEHGQGGCGRRDLGEPPVKGGSGEVGEGKVGNGGGRSGEGSALPERTCAAAAGEAEGLSAATSQDSDTGARDDSREAMIQRLARMVRLEIVEPARALPLLCPRDWRKVEGYVQCYELNQSPVSSRQSPAKRTWWERVLRGWVEEEGKPSRGDGQKVVVTEIITAERWQRYEDEVLVAEGCNSLGQVPLVHIQNTSVPFEYAGVSDVEGLIPLQDELNTRLSDRASRIALQSFRMYLGKGIENFDQMPISPGRMWTTDNSEAEVQEFGGDRDSPSETNHIADLREAMDKASGVSPIAAGAIKNRIGRLTSAAALRITLMSLLARTEKKRTTYGMGLERMIELALMWLDRAGVFATTREERRVELHWPSPLPENDVEKLEEAEIKTRLGVPKEVVLRELGY